MHFIYVNLPHPKHLTVKMVAGNYQKEYTVSQYTKWSHIALRTLHHM